VQFGGLLIHGTDRVHARPPGGCSPVADGSDFEPLDRCLQLGHRSNELLLPLAWQRVNQPPLGAVHPVR